MGETFGKYTLIERIGEGGMAEVHKARLTGSEGFDKILALKLILPHLSRNPDFLRMFIQEAKLSASLEHSNIVRVHDFDKFNDLYYLAMEYVHGSDLQRLLKKAKQDKHRVRIPEALIIALEVCKGLAYAHGDLDDKAPEVVHRDISPKNILVSRTGEVKITDFGIAKISTLPSMTSTGLIKGTYSYMSPEQASGEKLDGRSDIFSLGCVLWEMLTGQRLFAGTSSPEIIAKVKNASIQSISTYRHEASADLDALVLKMLARERDRRFETASGLSMVLDEMLAEHRGTARVSLIADLHQELFEDAPAGTKVMPAPPPEGKQSEPVRLGRLWWYWIAGAAALLVVGVVAALGVLWQPAAPEQDLALKAAGTQDDVPSTALSPKPPGAGEKPPVGLEEPLGKAEKALASRSTEKVGKRGQTRRAKKIKIPKGRFHLKIVTPPGHKALEVEVYLAKTMKLLGKCGEKKPLSGTIPVGEHRLLLWNKALGIKRYTYVGIEAGKISNKVIRF